MSIRFRDLTFRRERLGQQIIEPTCAICGAFDFLADDVVVLATDPDCVEASCDDAHVKALVCDDCASVLFALFLDVAATQ